MPRRWTGFFVPSVLALLGTVDGFPQGELLPDLVTLPCYLERNSMAYESDGVYLYFPNAIGNAGTEPLHILSVNDVDEDRIAYQRILLAGGDEALTPIGEFHWHGHPHNHFHLESIAHYRIHEIGPGESVGDEKAQADKTGFCLIDISNSSSCFMITTPGTYVRAGCCLGEPNCPQISMGISPGWHDVYDEWSIRDQRIRVNSVPNGQYWLVSQANPDDLVSETPASNNESKTKVVIIRDKDAHEPNDSKAQVDAQLKGMPPSSHLSKCGFPYIIQNLNVHQHFQWASAYVPDTDYVRFYVNSTPASIHSVLINFSHSVGDLNMDLYDAAWGLKGSSHTSTDIEEISLANLPVGWYYVRVYAALTPGFEDAGLYQTNHNYTLIINSPNLAICGDVNDDGLVNITDVIKLNASMYCNGTGILTCPMNADFDGNGQINCADRAALTSYVFSGSPAPNCP